MNAVDDELAWMGRVVAGRYLVTGVRERRKRLFVLCAEDRDGRELALQVAWPRVPEETVFRRFIAEARRIDFVKHHALVAVHEFGVDALDGANRHRFMYVVSDDVLARSLRDVITARGKLPVDEAVAFASEIASAMAAVHEHGTLLRDVEPARVFLVAPGDRLQVLPQYFLERSLHRFDDEDEDVEGDTSCIAPELITQGIADLPADVYACGAILFELVAGRPPFVEPTAGRQLMAILQSNAPRLSSLMRDVPRALEGLVAACLSRDEKKRPADGRALCEALAALK